MPEDAAAIAREAALEARTARTEIQSHVAECARRYADAAATMKDIRADVATLLERSARAEGRGQTTMTLLGGIPNAVWSVVIAGCASGATIAAVHFLQK